MLAKGGSLEFTSPPSRWLAFLIAGCVHFVTLSFIILGIWLLSLAAVPSTRFLGLILGTACLLFVWFLLLPRPARAFGTPIPGEVAPTLHQVTRQIAQALGGPPVDSIRFSITYNAAFGQFGWGRKSSLILGLPLLSVLSEQELVALLSHELAHDVNDDPSRGLILGTALDSLYTWYELLRPRINWETPIPFVFLVINIICLPIAGLIWVIGYSLSTLLWYDIQRAEYMADWLAAQISGTDAMLAVLDKAQFEETFKNDLKFAYLDHRMEGFFVDFKRRIAQVPDREIARIRRIEKLVGSRIDSSHPPTEYRVEFLKAHYFSEAEVVLSPSEFDQFKQELEPYLQKMQKQITDLDEITFQEVFGIGW
jgi:heat shock protein HtpX